MGVMGAALPDNLLGDAPLVMGAKSPGYSWAGEALGFGIILLEGVSST